MDIEKAISIALEAHRGQKDKGGNPYILHPLAVMNRVATIEEKIVAVLHDVVEDTEITLDHLRGSGFTEEIVGAIRLLTRSEEDSYEEFILKAAQNTISRNVKIADIEENMNLTRIKEPTEKDYKRLEKYKRALKMLKG
ncbi:GTP pyrophosphokinase [Paenibacillus timonensis]|nr:GTP pyrophosphokinase [Paenibacillus timonensis]MCH1643116.1 GTP pyrophosphokinase [Paenibacillus timonensis]